MSLFLLYSSLVSVFSVPLLEGPISISLRALSFDSICISDIDEGAVSVGGGNGSDGGVGGGDGGEG